MKTIVLPVDFSDTTAHLIEATVQFAKEVDAKICLIHITPTNSGFVVGDTGFQYFPEIEQTEIKRELSELNDLENLIKKQNIECEHLLKQGIASELILDYAKDKNADYIVMGSHGRSGIYDVFIGSLTKEITRTSPIPVLIIPCHQ
ncbi:MAG: universal stress protein UspA [Flavobacteriales bacterium]|nr:MAG: universal stress protein UspA [Flavobacteriales bacterium]